MKRIPLLIILSFILPAGAAAAGRSAAIVEAAKKKDPIVGRYKTIDDKTKKAASIVEISVRNGKVYGKIVKVYGEAAGARCEKCTGSKKNKPLKGLEILWGMKNKGDVYSGGTILDPANGKTYTCKIWIEGSKLKVRGYIAFFYRTQYWHRVK